MPYTVDPPPDNEQRILMEWLIRQFQKLADLSRQEGDVGLIVKGEAVPGAGAVQDDVNAHCFVGDWSDGECRACIEDPDLFYVGHSGILYVYFGPKPVCIGSGGPGGTYPHYVTQAGDWIPSGTTSHIALSNRDASDSHPQAAIGGRGGQPTLVADQANQDQRIAALEPHPPRTDNPHQVTHAQLPDNGSNDHATIDAHIADALIHFQDVPIDGFGYIRRDRTWAPATNIAILGGSPDSGTLGTGGLILTGWEGKAEAGVMVGAADEATGVIDFPETAWYGVTIHVHGYQGNDTKEESIWLDVEVIGGQGWIEVCHESVDTDKTNSRTLAVTFSRQFDAAESMHCRLRASAGLGTFVFDACTFEVKKLI